MDEVFVEYVRRQAQQSLTTWVCRRGRAFSVIVLGQFRRNKKYGNETCYCLRSVDRLHDFLGEQYANHLGWSSCCVYCKGNAVDDKIRFLSKESLRSDNFMLLIRPTKCILKRLFAVDLRKNVIVYQHNAKPRESHPGVSSSNITCQIAMPCHLH